MKVHIYKGELYPMYEVFHLDNDLWEHNATLPEDFNIEDYEDTCHKWDEYQDKLEELYEVNNL